MTKEEKKRAAEHVELYNKITDDAHRSAREDRSSQLWRIKMEQRALSIHGELLVFAVSNGIYEAQKIVEQFKVAGFQVEVENSEIVTPHPI